MANELGRKVNAPGFDGVRKRIEDALSVLLNDRNAGMQILRGQVRDQVAEILSKWIPPKPSERGVYPSSILVALTIREMRDGYPHPGLQRGFGLMDLFDAATLNPRKWSAFHRSFDEFEWLYGPAAGR